MSNNDNNNDKKNIKATEIKMANTKDAPGYMGTIHALRDANGVDPTISGGMDPTISGNVVPSDNAMSDKDIAASEALDKGLDKAMESASNVSSNSSSASSSSSSNKTSVKSSARSDKSSEGNQSSQSSNKASTGSDAAEQIAGHDSDATENLKGNNPIDKAPFSINPSNVQKVASVKMEHIVDICEKRNKSHEQLSSQDITRICSLTRSSIHDNEQAFNILESQIHSTLQKVKDSVKIVNYRQEKISDADPKANLKMINEMAQRGIPQRFDKDVRILTRILRDDPYFQRYKQENHLDTSIKPTKQFQAQSNKIKHENTQFENRQKANKSVKSATQSRN